MYLNKGSIPLLSFCAYFRICHLNFDLGPISKTAKMFLYPFNLCMMSTVLLNIQVYLLNIKIICLKHSFEFVCKLGFNFWNTSGDLGAMAACYL